MKAAVILLVLAGIPAIASASYFDVGSRTLLSAEAAGTAGSLALSTPSLDGLAGNPAALPQDSRLHWGFFGGQSSPGTGMGWTGLSVSLDESLRLGLAHASSVDERHGGLEERGYALALALAPTLGWSLGLRAQAQELQGAGLGSAIWGGGLDLGLLSAPKQFGIVPGNWTLAAWSGQTLSAWQDPDWSLAFPSSLHTGLAWRLGALSLGGGATWSSAPEQAQAWNLGAEARLPMGLALRAGWQDAGAWALGAGTQLPWGGLRLDYAFMGSGQLGRDAHRLSLQGAWEPPRPYRLRLHTDQLLQDPESGRVLRAQFRAELDPRLAGRAWSLELQDSRGRRLCVLEPRSGSDIASWDGLDSEGRPVNSAAGLRAWLRVQLDHAELQESFDLLAPGRQAPADSLPSQPTAAESLPALKVLPVFADEAGTQVSHVRVQIPGALNLDAKAWRLDIQDAQRRSLRVLKGDGALPGELIWDGRDEKGRRVQDALEVRMKLQVEDRAGRQRQRELPLFTQQAYEIARREARRRPDLRLASLGLPLLTGREPLHWSESLLPALRRRAESVLLHRAQRLRRERQRDLWNRYSAQGQDQAWVLDLFESGNARPLAQRLSLLHEVAARLGAGAERPLRLRGLSRSDEAQPQALARRRAWQAAQALWDQHGADLPLLLEAPKAAADAKGVRLQAWSEPTGLPLALDQARPDQVRAHYGDQDLEAQPDGAALVPPPRPVAEILEPWGLQLSPNAATAWSPASGKLTFFHQGWIWLSDAEGSSLRPLWYEPDLQAAGRLRFGPEGRRLWLSADAWRRWLSLELDASTEP